MAMTMHSVYCPLGCLFDVSHFSEVAEHNAKHLEEIVDLIKYRANKLDVCDKVMAYIEQAATQSL